MRPPFSLVISDIASFRAENELGAYSLGHIVAVGGEALFSAEGFDSLHRISFFVEFQAVQSLNPVGKPDSSVNVLHEFLA